MTIPELAGQLLTTLRAAQKASVHCIVGGMAETFASETLRSIGVTASMTHDVREVDDFVDESHGVLIQLATHSEAKEAGILTAIDTARKTGKPWVLNLRAAHRSVFRRELARRLADNRPRIIIGKPAELSAPLRLQGGSNLQTIAGNLKTALVKTGTQPVIADALKMARIENGSDLSESVDVMDIATASLCAAFATQEVNGFKAAACGALVTQIAAMRAGAAARGPGSFVVNFLDEVATLTPDTIAADAKVTFSAPDATSAKEPA